MDTPALGHPTVVDVQSSGLSWAAIFAGAIASAALSLVLLALGAGLGLSAVSPWASSGISAATFKVGSGIYLCCIAVMASAMGGYLAARLRTRWTGLHTNEVYFRDTAHGFIAWAFATLLLVGFFGIAASRIIGGVASGAAGGGEFAQAVNPAEVAVDKLLRPANLSTGAATPGAPATAAAPFENPSAVRAEVLRLWTSSLRSGDISAPDKSYLTRVVAARTGLSQADAEKRVNDVVNQTKAEADKVRHNAAVMSFWLTAALFFGAFAASLAAVEGGQLRDGTWNGPVLTPRPL